MASLVLLLQHLHNGGAFSYCGNILNQKVTHLKHFQHASDLQHHFSGMQGVVVAEYLDIFNTLCMNRNTGVLMVRLVDGFNCPVYFWEWSYREMGKTGV
jgi:hypothetical protein